MAVRRSHKKRKLKQRKPFWQAVLEWILKAGKRLIIPALLLWLIGWLWLGGVFAKGYDAARDNFIDWTAAQGLVVEDVIIEGRYRTERVALQDALGVDRGAALLSVDVEFMQARVAALPWVKSVTVARAYNGIITVRMTERIPFVLWDRPGRDPVVLDTDGEIIKGADYRNHQALLIISGVDAPKHAITLIEHLMAEPDVRKHIRAAEWIGDRRWDLLTIEGLRVHLPEMDLGYALSRLAKLQAEKNIMDRGLLSIDLRPQDRIIIETPRGEARDAVTLSSAVSNAI